MDGYKLVTADDKELGEIVGRLGDSVVVEHGLLRKSRHAIPLAFADAHDDEQIVRTTLSKEMIESSPKIDDDGDVDETQIAAYYGLADTTADPGTLGYDEPATTRDEEERAPLRDALEPGEGPLDHGASPGITGGDRYRDAER